MSKLTILIICLILMVSLFGVSSNAQVSKGEALKADPNETSQSKISDLQVTLDKKVTQMCCRFYPNSCSEDQEQIKVSVSLQNTKNENLNYKYIVSGGQIIGKGTKVIWDFSKEKPGTYTMKVIADDGRLINLESEVKSVILNLNPACDPPSLPCSCPNLSATSPTKSVKADETINFTANVSGGSQESVAYNWTISRGTIIEGQSTPNIKVKTTSEMVGETVTATVELSGVCADCSHVASVAVYIEKP